MSLIGIHIDDLTIDNINNAYNNNIKLLQFFVNPLQKKIDNDHIKSIIKLTDQYKIRLLIHSSYSINIAKPWSTNDWGYNVILQEIKLCSELNGIGVIVHMGKKLKLSTSEAINNMYTFLLAIHRESSNYNNIKIILETPAGQGSELCYKLEDLAHFTNKFFKHVNPDIKNRFGICVDTCHIFAAGYDISSSKGISKYFENFNELIGIDKIKLVHINDSKNEVGSKKDRHENLDKGFIGKNNILDIVRFFGKLMVPMILETPFSNIYNDYFIITS